MKSFNVHTHSRTHCKRNKRRRPNAMKNTVSRERIPPQIFNVYDRIQKTENVKRISNFNYQVVEAKIELKTNYQENFNISCSHLLPERKLPEIKLCPEIMTLLPSNQNQCRQSVKSKFVRNHSTLLARLTMNALAASETDINAILQLVETMYSSIKEMIQNVKQKQQAFSSKYKPSQLLQLERKPEPRYVIKIDLKKFLGYLNEQYIKHNPVNVPQIESNRDLTVQVPYWKQPSMSYPTNKCRSFNILVQPRRLSFNISVCKFNSCSIDFFQRLANFYSSCSMTHNTRKRKPVPSVFVRDWHFRNVSQGYLLSVLLKNNNVMSLNVMRKLYFVIITSVTPNLTIEINFKLANGIFMAYDSPPFERLPFEVIHWNDRHRNVLRSSSKILYTPAFSYNIPYRGDLKNNLRDTKSDITLHNRSVSDSSSTLKYESSSEYEGSDYFIRSTTYSESGFLDLKSTESSTNLTLRESVKTLTLSIDDVLSYHVFLNNRKDCGDMNFYTTYQEQYNMYNSTIQQSRTWMSKVFRESYKLKNEVFIPCLNSLMNETVFDRLTMSMGNCYSSFTQYWMRIRSRQFGRRFLIDLGSYLVHSLCTSLIY